MAISVDTLIEEKTLLQKDFDSISKKAKQIENDLLQMRNNLNALNGAIQQTSKLISLAQDKKGKK